MARLGILADMSATVAAPPPRRIGTGRFVLRIRGKEPPEPTLLDVTSFLYDFNLLYEISRLALDPRYEQYRFSRYTYFRKGRPLAPSRFH